MPPTAATAAGRQSSKRGGARAPRPVAATPPRTPAAQAAPRARAPRTQATARTKASSHRGTLSRSPLPKLPRRISGPVAARGGGVSLPLPGFAPPSLPLRERVPRTRARPPRPARPQRLPRDRQLARRALQGVLSLPDLPLLDRIVRGRTWIALLGVMLAGIVTMQVEVLKLGREIGAATGQATVLQSRNELLRASVAGLSNVQRIEQLAVQQGMVMPPPTGIGFVASSGAGGDAALIQHALANIHTPNPSSFGTQSTSNGGLTVAAGATTAVPPSTGG
ncbi:MAG: hypothetical protein ACYDHH_02670 [Solirubrobacteraceae bacterium]